MSSPSTPPAVLPQPPIDPQRSLTLFVTPFAFVLSFLLLRPFSTSLYPPFSLRQPTPVRIYSLSFLVPSLFIARSSFSPVSPFRTPMAAVPLLSLSLLAPIRLFLFFSLCELRTNNPTQQPTPTPKTRKLCYIPPPLSLSLILCCSPFVFVSSYVTEIICHLIICGAKETGFRYSNGRSREFV